MNHWWRREKPQRTRRKPVHEAAITGLSLMPKAMRSACKDSGIVITASVDEVSLCQAVCQEGLKLNIVPFTSSYSKEKECLPHFPDEKSTQVQRGLTVGPQS